MVSLSRIQSRWSREERNSLNLNWTKIEEGFTALQRQINILAGDQEVDELLKRIDTALSRAQNEVSDYIETIDLEVDEAITKNNEKTDEAIRRNNLTVNEALLSFSEAINELNSLSAEAQELMERLNVAKDNTEEATRNANVAATEANDAANSVQTAINEMQVKINQFRSKLAYSDDTEYSLNNLVTFQGSSYIYINNNPSKGNQPPLLPTESNDYWQLIARRGLDGEGSVSSVNGVLPDADGDVKIAVAVTKEDVGLGNVDNTSDVNKPVSNAQKTAIEAVERNAKNYTDQQVQDIVGGGVPKLVSNEHLIECIEEGQTVFIFEDELFSDKTDTTLAFLDGEPLAKNEYTMNDEGQKYITIDRTNIPIGATVRLVIFRNVPVGPDGAINAAILQNGTITQEKLSEDVVNNFAKQSDITELQQTIENIPIVDLEPLQQQIQIHTGNDGIHVTPAQKTQWNNYNKIYAQTQVSDTTLVFDFVEEDLKTYNFVARYGNGGQATTVNGKPLYKENTTAAPTLVKDKVYTIWYSAAANNGNGAFFIKASATGNATAANVLAGKTFSNDEGADIVGTMINNAGQGEVVAWENNDKNTGVNVPIPQDAYYTRDSWFEIIDQNLIPANILSGKSIFGVSGTAQAGRKYVTGTAISTNYIATYADMYGSNRNLYMLTLPVLSFTPSMIYVRATSINSTPDAAFAAFTSFGVSTHSGNVLLPGGIVLSIGLNSSPFTMPVLSGTKSYTWYAWE